MIPRSRGEWFALASVVTTLVVGLPPTINLISGGNAGLAVLVILLVLGLLGAVGILYFMSRRPQWTILDHKAKLRIHEPDGSRATYRKTLKLRSNRKGLRHYTHRKMGSDGRMSGFSPDPRSEVVKVESNAGDTAVTVEFPHALGFGEEIVTYLEFDLEDAFLDNPEEFQLQVDEPMRCAAIEVQLPEERPATDALSFHRYTGTDGVDPPSIREGNVHWWIKAGFLRKVPYGDYVIRWFW